MSKDKHGKNEKKRTKKHTYYGFHIDHQARQMAYNVFLYFKDRKRDKTTWEYETDVNLNELVAKVTCLDGSTIRRIVNEGNCIKSKLEEGEKVVFKPKEKYKSTTKIPRKKKYDIDDSLLKKHLEQIFIIRNSKRLPCLDETKAWLENQGFEYKCPDKYLEYRIRKVLSKSSIDDDEPKPKKRKVKKPTWYYSNERNEKSSIEQEIEVPVTIKLENIQNTEINAVSSNNEIFIKSEKIEIKQERN